MFKQLRISFKKSKILSQISREKKEVSYSELADKLKSDLVHGKTLSKYELLLEELFLLLSQDQETISILEFHKLKIRDLRNIIKKLELEGAGGIVRGHYVPVSSIAFTKQLDVVLTFWDGENFKVEEYDISNSNSLVASMMIEQFE